jgi:hypothetical protein
VICWKSLSNNGIFTQWTGGPLRETNACILTKQQTSRKFENYNLVCY